MADVCFWKPEVVISQPWTEIYQTSIVTKHATGFTGIRMICDAMAAILRNRFGVITAAGRFGLMKFGRYKQVTLIEA